MSTQGQGSKLLSELVFSRGTEPIITNWMGILHTEESNYPKGTDCDIERLGACPVTLGASIASSGVLMNSHYWPRFPNLAVHVPKGFGILPTKHPLAGQNL